MRPIKIYNPTHAMYPVIKTCLSKKDLIITECGPSIMPDDIVIKDKNLEVRGLLTCIEYLDDKYPHPPFFPIEPEKRAIIRMMINELMSQPSKIEIYTQQLPEGTFFSGNAPSILDIFLYALAPDTGPWRRFKSLVDNSR